ncbi:MAG: VCBS repeat-containing protein [Chloroflexi bacterium]|nr:VCBS repeat-containing protein [Chloroflexota bacterium]
MEADLSDTTDVFYEDLNGDGEMDLVLSDLQPSWGGEGIVAVFLWLHDHYARPFVIKGYAKYFPYQRVSFEDWTGDGIPEVIFDFKGDFGGTGYFSDSWRRNVIYCRDSCNVIWDELVAQTRRWNAIGLTYTNIERGWNEDNDPEIRVAVAESFNAPDMVNVFEDRMPLRVFTTTLTVFVWSGDVFEQIEEQVLADSYSVESQSVLTATDKLNTAIITAEPYMNDGYRPFYKCTLYVNDVIIVEPFDCYRDFTTVDWFDLTGDGQKEVIVRTPIFDEQRLLAYQWNGDRATQIADVTGDIIRSDLYGVRYADVDDDGQLEILAGELHYQTDESTCKTYGEPFFVKPSASEVVCWRDLTFGDLIYRWDGERFLLGGASE